jgi:hypothetical protein
MNTQTVEKRQKEETRQEVETILNSYETKEGVRYWLNVLVREGKLSSSRAGRIIVERRLI